jgi:hypothetical protein
MLQNCCLTYLLRVCFFGCWTKKYTPMGVEKFLNHFSKKKQSKVPVALHAFQVESGFCFLFSTAFLKAVQGHFLAIPSALLSPQFYIAIHSREVLSLPKEKRECPTVGYRASPIDELDDDL